MSETFKVFKEEFELIESIDDKIKILVVFIVGCSNEYYDDNSSPVSDFEFDTICEWLENIDPENEILTKTGFGYEVGKDGIKHPYHEIVGISNKINITEGDIVNNGDATISSKYDGCSLEHYYKNNYYYMSITRGKEGIGKDVTVASRKKVPHEIERFRGYIRVEGVVSYTNFKKFPDGMRIRNAVSGVIGAKTLKHDLLELIDFIPVSVYNADDDIIYHPDTQKFHEYTKGFKICPILRVVDGDIKLDNELLDSIREDYAVDGFVCYKDNDILCAYKYPNEYAYPKVLSVESKTQPTGKIFPSSIHIEPTEISDCVTSKVTGKSGETVINGKIGPGAVIEIVRSGEVVPNWTKNVIKESDDVWEPHCSYGCDDKYIKWVKANCYCTNPECPSVFEAIVDKTLRQFAPKGFSDDMSDMVIEHMKNWVTGTELNVLEMFLEYMCIHYRGWDGGTVYQKKLIDETFKVLIKKEMTLYDLVTVCSIEAFGKSLSRDLEPKLHEWTKGAGCVDRVSYILMNRKEFTSDEVNNSKARESWKKRHHILYKMMEVFDIILPEIKAVGKNGTVCISGNLPSGTKKKAFVPEIEQRGYSWVESLKKDTTILICANLASNKANKARKNKIATMSEEEFLAL